MKKLIVSILFLTTSAFGAEYVKFKSFDTRLKLPTEVLAEVHFPKTGNAPYPVIIAQHGSSPKERFKNGEGHTDIYVNSVIKQGVDNGYVVVAIDAFYNRPLGPTTKNQFPNSTNYAFELKNILMKDDRFNPKQFFYTGWSYGGLMSIDAFGRQYANDPNPWRAVGPSEAGCQFQPTAIKLPYPVIFVLAEDSHYPPKPCLYYADRLKELGNTVETVVIPNANHHYSTYGKGRSGSSQSLNGCTDNPVIKDYPSWRHADGTLVTGEQAWKNCTTWQGGDGGAADKLDESVNYIIRFFNKQK